MAAFHELHNPHVPLSATLIKRLHLFVFYSKLYVKRE